MYGFAIKEVIIVVCERNLMCKFSLVCETEWNWEQLRFLFATDEVRMQVVN